MPPRWCVAWTLLKDPIWRVLTEQTHFSESPPSKVCPEQVNNTCSSIKLVPHNPSLWCC